MKDTVDGSFDWSMPDIRHTTVFTRVERFLAGLHGPDRDAIVDAADPDLSRDTSRLALTVTRVIATDQPPVTRVATVDLRDGAVAGRTCRHLDP